MSQKAVSLLKALHKEIAVISTTPEGVITTFSHVAENLLGYEASEIIGQPLPLNDLQNCLDALNSQDSQQIQHHFHHKDGQAVALDCTLTAIKAPDGNITGVLFTAHSHMDAENFQLSALPNEEIFNIVFEREISRTQRENQEIALLRIDVDHYKDYLSSHGETKTQEMLAEIGETLYRRIQRASDFLAYTCHDEFFVLLPNTDRSGTVKLSEQLRLLVAGLHIENKASEYNVVTVSIGITHTKANRDTTKESLFEETQTSLSIAKQEGRNCSRLFEAQ